MATKQLSAQEDDRTERQTRIAAQAETVIESILKDKPHLRSIRDANRKEEEPTDRFAREFLRVFRQRLQAQ
jgi:hypothetical protein